MNCPQCGKQYTTPVNFCTACGAALNEAAAIANSIAAHQAAQEFQRQQQESWIMVVLRLTFSVMMFFLRTALQMVQIFASMIDDMF